MFVIGEDCEWVDINLNRRHAELVSAPHHAVLHHAGDLSCGILKQVQDDETIFLSSPPTPR